MKLVDEFKAFALRGNVFDVAVGVIIGGAFGKIVTSLVGDVLMPMIGILIGGVDFSGLSLHIGDADIKYGSFIQNIIDFLIVAICIFALIKLINIIFKKKEEDKTTPAQPTEEVKLLSDIRDLLKNK